MTLRQQLLKFVYPFFIWYQKLKGRKNILCNKGLVPPSTPFYKLSVQLNNGQMLNFESLKGKKVLLVNTASDCGYTNQYSELQKLYQQSKQDMEIIAFPANDFKEQEKGNDKKIMEFCQTNFYVRFFLAKKTVVKKNAGQHPVFQWLTDKEQNGWNDRQPAWNFSKYLVNEEGILTHYFDPAVSPVSEEVIKAVQQ